MAVPRNKGQFAQAGVVYAIPRIDGSFLSVDGMLDLDAVYLQADYPLLFANIGIVYNEPGDDDLTQFRLPAPSVWGLPTGDGINFKWMVRF